MSVFNITKIELFVVLIITLSIFVAFNFDIYVYNFFLSYNENDSGIYLKEFFVNITELGSSFWYFGTSLISLAVLFFIKKTQFFKINEIDKKLNFFLSVVFYLLAVGIITQLIKHFVGRARPNYTDFEVGFNFNYFTLDSSFHSFPSGHSSTIFMVCFILIAILPKLKYFFYALAAIIALSRVVVSAHFLSDVIAGALLALLVYKFLNNFFGKKNKNYLFNEIIFINSSNLYYSLIFLLGICLFLSVGPSLDLFIAKLFYHGNAQFSLQSFDFLSLFFREILIPLILIYLLILPIIGKYIKLDKIYFGHIFSNKEILLIWITQILSLLIFVNLFLKNFWGRARPGDVKQLDGDGLFTPWYQLSSSCETNCSFVSGDASVGFAVVILYFITKNNFFLYSALLLGFLLGFIRILAGGHFLSDIVFSGFFIILLSMLIHKVYKRYYE